MYGVLAMYSRLNCGLVWQCFGGCGGWGGYLRECFIRVCMCMMVLGRMTGPASWKYINCDID